MKTTTISSLYYSYGEPFYAKLFFVEDKRYSDDDFHCFVCSPVHECAHIYINAHIYKHIIYGHICLYLYMGALMNRTAKKTMKRRFYIFIIYMHFTCLGRPGHFKRFTKQTVPLNYKNHGGLSNKNNTKTQVFPFIFCFQCRFRGS